MDPETESIGSCDTEYIHFMHAMFSDSATQLTLRTRVRHAWFRESAVMNKNIVRFIQKHAMQSLIVIIIIDFYWIIRFFVEWRYICYFFYMMLRRALFPQLLTGLCHGSESGKAYFVQIATVNTLFINFTNGVEHFVNLMELRSKINTWGRKSWTMVIQDKESIRRHSVVMQ